jgi:hypothetical protein
VHVMTIDSTVRKMPFHLRGGVAAVVAFFGFFAGLTIFLLIPFVGWVVGTLIMVASAGLLGFMFYRGPTYAGNCPFCGSHRLTGEPGTIGKCEQCHQRFIHRDGLLVKEE